MSPDLKLAIFSDVHGNPAALDAVLRDIEAQGGVDGYWIVGDFSALGYDPVTPLERITALDNVTVVRGNTDRFTVADDLGLPTREALDDDPDLLRRHVHIVSSFSWTRGYITAHGWYDWLAALPLEQRLTLPDGTRLLAVHASPGQDSGPGLAPDMTDDEVRDRFAGSDADLVVVGHTHLAHDRRIDGLHLVNLGSVSNPPTPDRRAHYVLLEADAGGYRLESRRVAYDIPAMIDAARRVHHPAEDYFLHFFA